MNDPWTKENGKEKLWWAENAVGKLFLTSPMSPLPAGYELRSTTNPREMDRVFNRMHQQERDENEKFIEKLYYRGREFYDRTRSALRQKLSSSSTTDAEKNIIRECLKLMNEKDSRMQENHAYGVSAMQETEAPIASPTSRIKVN